jgi:hypothetical protein
MMAPFGMVLDRYQHAGLAPQASVPAARKQELVGLTKCCAAVLLFLLCAEWPGAVVRPAVYH